MRISGGEKKGLKLKGPKKSDIRPMTSIVKEFIFEFLFESVKNKRVLDFFAGTGSVGLEAISRSAESVVFIDISQHSVYLIRENIKRTGFEKSASIFKADAFNFISRMYKKKMKFDIALADPPFKYKYLYRFCENEKLFDIIEDGGYFIIEHYPEIKEENYYKGFELVKFRSFGGNKVSIFKKVGKS